MTAGRAVSTLRPGQGVVAPPFPVAVHQSFDDLAVSTAGVVAFTQHPSSGEPGSIVMWSPAGAAEAVVIPSPGREPSWSSDGTMLAFRSGVRSGELCIVPDVGRPEAVVSLPVVDGGDVASVSWIPRTHDLLVIAAPGDNDGAVLDGALRPMPKGWPERRTTHTGTRILLRVDAVTGTGGPMSPADLTIWEAAALTGDRAIAIVSDDPTESGWYGARLSTVDAHGETTVYRSGWQLASPTPSPDGSSFAFIEGWSSDRGRLAGDVVLCDLQDGRVERIAGDELGLDVTGMYWIDPSNLWVCGWRRLRAAWAIVDPGRRRIVARNDEPRTVALAPLPSPDGLQHVIVGVGADGSQSVEVAEAVRSHRTDADPPGTTVVRWLSSDGFEIEGLLLSDQGKAPSEQRLIIMVHGGPANLWTDVPPEGARALVAAGYAVLLPNPRGSVGRGQAFARANLGDPAGGELEDLLAGADACRLRGLVMDARPGIVGGSYGGYLAACAAVFSSEVGAAVAMFGHPDLPSARVSSNNRAFYDRLLGGTHHGFDMMLAYDRSPVFHVDETVPPVLLLHGDRDACTPLGQSEELLGALASASVDAELVVYPGEGHGLKGPRAKQDAWLRTIEWFDRHLGGEGC